MFLKWCCTMFLTFQHPSLPAVPLALNPRLVGTPIILLRVFVLYPVFLGQFGGCEAFKDWHVGIPGWNIRSRACPCKGTLSLQVQSASQNSAFETSTSSTILKETLMARWEEPHERNEWCVATALSWVRWHRTDIGASCGSGSAGNCHLQLLIFIFKGAFLNFISVLAMQ